MYRGTKGSKRKGAVKATQTKSLPPKAAAETPPVAAAPAVPGWFSWALAEPVDQSLMVAHEGRKIHVLRWGSSPTKRALLFVHGGGASAAWYRFIAPFFAAEFDTLAMSFSGCGESGWADQYSQREWGREILAVCEALHVFSPERQGKPLVVAHSMGTYITMHALSHTTQHLDGVVLVDAAVRNLRDSVRVHKRIVEMRKTDPTAQVRDGWNINPPSVTPLQRFKLRPFQQCDNQYILKFIADSGAVPAADDGGEGWHWRGDPNRDAKFDWTDMLALTDDSMRAVAKRSGSRMAFVYGEESVLCDTHVVDFIREHLLDVVTVVGVPAAGHHVWLDQPIAFVGILRSLFAAWGCAAKSSTQHEDEEFIRREAALEARL